MFLMSQNKKDTVTDKHIELLADQPITLVYPLFGNFQGNIPGKITGRVRNRFKQFIFTPTFPFMSFYFTSSDVVNIQIIKNAVFLVLGKTEEKKKRRKKKKALPVVEIEAADKSIDLNKPIETAVVVP